MNRGKKIHLKEKEDKPKTEKNVKTIENIRSYNKAEHNLPRFNIKSVELSVLTDEEKEDIAEVLITHAKDEIKGGKSDNGNLLSNELGASSFALCSTCTLPLMQCTAGHVGIIRFPKGIKTYVPIVFEDVLVKLLNCVCYVDGSYFYSLTDIKEKLSNKLKDPIPQKLTELKKISESGVCKHNDKHVRRRYSVRKTGKYKELVYTYGNDTEKKEANINEIEELLHKLQAEDEPSIEHKGNKITQFLGITKLKGYISRSILVPPGYLRQSFECKGNVNNHDITKIYIKILKLINDYTNNKKAKNNTDSFLLMKELYLQIESLHKDNGNNYNGVKKNDIGKELKGKKGTIRRYMFAKVNEIVARLVIDGDSRLRVDQVMIPFNLKYILTIPVEVTDENIDDLVKMGQEGRISKIEYKSGKSKGNILPVHSGNISMRTGDIIYRHLMNDDIIIINRQPSLWIGNMLSFRVVLNHDRSSNVMKFNQAICQLFNADFDGDEMNINLPQTLKGQADARDRMFITNNLLSRNKSAPGFGLILDSVVSFFYCVKDTISKSLFDLCFNEIYTTEYSEFTERLIINQEMNLRKITPNMYEEDIISGRLLISALFPPDFTYNKNGVNIKNGILIEGDNISKNLKSIVHSLANDYNNETAVNFINCATFAMGIYLDHHGLTVSLDDYYQDNDDEEAKIIRRSIEALIQKTNDDILYLESAKRETKNGLERKNIEDKIKEKLNTLSFLIINIIRNDKKGKKNHFLDMVDSGAKGNNINIVQLIGAVGQPYFTNERPSYVIPYFNNKSRFFNRRKEGEHDIINQGFVGKSYYSGIPMKIISHSAYSAREGQIANVEIVPNAGNLFRSLSNALCGVKGRKDGSVRMGRTILQRIFAGDGLDPMFTFNVEYKKEQIHFFIDIPSVVDKINSKHGVFKINTNIQSIKKLNNPPLLIETKGERINVRDDILLLGGTYQRAFEEYLVGINSGKIYIESDDDKEIEALKLACNKLNKKYTENNGFSVEMDKVNIILVKNMKEILMKNNINILLGGYKIYVNNRNLVKVLKDAFSDIDYGYVNEKGEMIPGNNVKVHYGKSKDKGKILNWIY